MGIAMENTEDPQQQHTILALIDGSPEAAGAITVALALSRIYDVGVHVLCFCRRELSPRELTDALHLPPADRHGVVVEQESRRIGDAIAEQIDTRRCLLVCLASRWPSDEPGRALGFAAEQVVSILECPVMLVPSGFRWPAAAGCSIIRRILLPSDGSPSTASGLQPAMELAGRCGAEVHVLHVADPKQVREYERGAMTAPRYVDQPQYEWPAWAGEFINRLCLAQGGCPIRTKVFFAKGDPAEAILRFQKEHDDDLICIVWRGRFVMEHARIFRQVVEHAQCPVLVLRAAPRF